jgi:hypothetical protein
MIQLHTNCASHKKPPNQYLLREVHEPGEALNVPAAQAVQKERPAVRSCVNALVMQSSWYKRQIKHRTRSRKRAQPARGSPRQESEKGRRVRGPHDKRTRGGAVSARAAARTVGGT